jgi:lipid II isoglutaminyl synthase (glutamine-hydrolysing)
MTSGTLRPPLRTQAAVAVGKLASRTSQLLGRGHGTVIGGNITLKLDPGALKSLVGNRPVAVITGTNGKSTTTRLVREALGSTRRTASNRGANMPPGLIEAAADQTAQELVFEVDELYVPQVVEATKANLLVLLNLSRDQLDRITEIRRVAELWRALLARVDWRLTIIANADDPLLVWAVGDYAQVVWVSAGYRWKEDAALCPNCSRVRAISADGTWTCECGLNRPTATWTLDPTGAIGPTGHTPFALSLPGDFNRSNALVALAVAAERGINATTAVGPMEKVVDVSGRYVTANVDGRPVRLFLAKNPASWTEMLHLLSHDTASVVFVLNARIADGQDTSWLWDVPFEQVAGRAVIASGDRRLDLAYRLQLASVEHTVAHSALAAIKNLPPGPVELLATYTAFHDVLKELHVEW